MTKIIKNKAIILVTLLSISIFPGMSHVLIDSIKIINFSHKVYSNKVLRFALTSSSPGFTLKNSINQRIIKQKHTTVSHTVIIETGRFNSVQQKTADTNSMKEYLENTQFLNLNNKALKTISKTFENTPRGSLISAIEKYVFNYITTKSSGIPFAAAKDIINSKEGDCTEHAILSIAILRSLNVPARAVVGMYLSKNWLGKKNIFVYHMWAEAFINGTWHLVESALDEKHYNRYIAFTYHNLRTSIPLSYLKVISSIKDLQVRYVDK